MRPLRTPLFVVIAICAILCINLAIAQKDGRSPPVNDLEFLQEAATSSRWMVELGNIAQKQAASREVRNYGTLMDSGHGRILEEIRNLTNDKRLFLVDQMDYPRQNTINVLSREYGAAFDRYYISVMIDENRRDAELYRLEAERGSDPQIRQFAFLRTGTLEGYARLAEKYLLNVPNPLLK